MMKPLYEISSDYTNLINSGLEKEDEQAFNDTLESIEFDLEEKAINVARFVKNLEAEAKAVKEAEETMLQRRKSLEGKAKRLKEYLRYNMFVSEKQEFKSADTVIKLRNNPPAVVIIDESKVPLNLIKVQLNLTRKELPEGMSEYIASESYDKKAIKDLIKSDNVEWARLESTQRVEIK